jgi:hypothetical protein
MMGLEVTIEIFECKSSTNVFGTKGGISAVRHENIDPPYKLPNKM